MFDIDNTIIIVLKKNNQAKLIKRKINLISQLYNKCNIIKIFTLRFIRKHN